MSSSSMPANLEALQEENLRLKRAIEELSILNDLARVIGGSLNSQEIMQTIIHRSLRAVRAEQGVIILVDPKSGQTMTTLVRSMVSSNEHPRYHMHQNLLGWMHLNKKPLMINQPREDSRFPGIRWEEGVSQILSVPMIVKSELRGVLTVYNKKDGRLFAAEDQSLLAIIAAQSAQVVENARLYEQEKELVGMQEEIRLASQIQQALLPKTFPNIPGYDIAATSVPAQTVGGDYYDFIPIDEHNLAVGLGDVSGKGFPAAMLMANLQATLRGQCLIAASPGECLRRSNKLLFRSTSEEKFSSLFYGIIDKEKNEFRYSNAGQNPPFHFSEGKVERLKAGGVILSMMEDFDYQESSVAIRPGDLLILYSDGITEAINKDEEEFGEDRFVDLITKLQETSACQIMDAVIAAVGKHAGNLPQMDDMTLMIIKRLKN